MHIFYTKSVQHLKERMGNSAHYQTMTFADGELLINIEESLDEKKVFVLTATPAGHDALIELFLLLDVLKRMKARLYLFFTYFGYARQAGVAENQSHARALIFDILTRFNPEFCGILHMHCAKTSDVFDYRNSIPINFFIANAHHVDYIVAPDEGASELAIQIADCVKKPFVILKKKRENDHIRIDRVLLQEIKGKKILIVDDIIATGKTVAVAASMLYEAGVLSVDVAATHGVFVENALDVINKSGIKNISVTNSLPQKLLSENMHVWDITAFIKSIMNQDL